MATVGTSSQSDLLSGPPIPGVNRDSTNGRLYAVIRTAADTLSVYRSVDSGASWSSWSSFSHTGLQEWSRFFLDKNGFGHLAYRVNTGTADIIYYRRLDLGSAAWSAALQCSNTDANGGVAGARWQGVDIAVVRHSNGAYAIAVVGAQSDVGARFGMIVMGVSITEKGVIYSNNGIIVNNRFYTEAGTPPGRQGVACEIEHNGDGVTSSTPHLWVTWGRVRLSMVKLAWQGTAIGWSGPSDPQVIRPTIPAHNYVGGRWDGRNWVMSVINPDNNATVRLYERNQANTTTAIYDSPTHPQGNVTSVATSYDSVTRDIRVFAVGTSSNVLYYCDYTRETGVWTAWATVTATAVLSGTEWTVRHGGSSGDARHHVLTTASGSPNTVSETAQSSSSIPNNATWDTSSVPYLNGGAADVNAALTLDWTFFDPDPGQTQGSYALSRQIGAGTVQYWNAGTSSWGASEVQNASGTSALTLASGWAAGTDLPYTFKVKVWDNTGTSAAGYSNPLILIPSVKVNPTITSPSGTISTDLVPVSWTVSEQSQFRVRITTPGGAEQFNSGWITDSSTTSYTPTYRMVNGATNWIAEVTTRNAEGLTSNAATATFSVSYAAPPAPISTFVPSTTGGYIAVSSSNLAPVGSQPAITSADLYRRPAITSVLNSNSNFAGNVTGWSVGGGGTLGTLSYSTAQAHEGAGSARYVPSATGSASPSVESTAQLAVDLGKTYYGSGWIRPDTSTKPIFIAINWYNASGTYLGSTTTTVSAPVANAWHFLEVVGDPNAFANTAKATVSIGESSTPAAVNAFYADEVKFEEYDSTTGVRIATGLLPPVTYNDWGAAASTEYEYRWLAVGANGTSIYGPWTQ